MKIRHIIIITLSLGILGSCRQKDEKTATQVEDSNAKTALQGVWIDSDTQEVNFRAKGDTIYYPDSISQPAYFKIVGDTIIIGENRQKYAIVKYSDNIFWFKNSNDDIVKLQKSDNPDDIRLFSTQKPKVLTYTEVVKRDTVVNYDNQRYHCYIAINPTRYKVHRATYNEDGVEVDNIYYDNIVHISVYKGAECLYSHDIRKDIFKGKVPMRFLSQSILSNVEFSKVDSRGFHFDTTVCIPDGASCYMLDVTIGFGGKAVIQLLEY